MYDQKLSFILVNLFYFFIYNIDKLVSVGTAFPSPSQNTMLNIVLSIEFRTNVYRLYVCVCVFVPHNCAALCSKSIQQILTHTHTHIQINTFYAIHNVYTHTRARNIIIVNLTGHDNATPRGLDV